MTSSSRAPYLLLARYVQNWPSFSLGQSCGLNQVYVTASERMQLTFHSGSTRSRYGRRDVDFTSCRTDDILVPVNTMFSYNSEKNHIGHIRTVVKNSCRKNSIYESHLSKGSCYLRVNKIYWHTRLNWPI